MAEREGFYLIVYDIRHPRRLQRIGRAMEDFGVRVQYSVFEANLTEKSLRKMKSRINGLMEKDDSLRIYKLCQNCRGSVEVKGGPEPQEEPIYYRY